MGKTFNCPYAYETIYSEVVSGNGSSEDKALNNRLDNDWSIGLRRISPKMNNMNNVADFYISIRSGFAFFVISVEF